MNNIVSSSRVYIDSNVFIYFVEGTGELLPKAKTLFQEIVSIGAQIITSEITLAECLYQPGRKQDLKLITIYEDLFEKSGTIELIPLNGLLTKQAALHGGQLGLKLIDAIHYESALQSGCDVLVSADAGFKSGPKMRVLRFS